MKKWMMILGLIAAMMLSACEQREPAGVATQTRAEREGQTAGESAQQPAAPSDQTAAMPPAAGQQATDSSIAGSPSTTVPPSATQEQSGARTGSETGQVAGSPSQGTQPGSSESQGATGTRESSEFYGQSPQFGNAPETIVLKAANGNVTLPHKKHAGMMDCKSCHGDATPGPIEGFNKDQAHSLCTGCHKEKGAGPTKCQECHKKQ